VAGEVVRRTWDAIHVAGKQVGFYRTTVYRTADDGPGVQRVEKLMRLAFSRFGDMVQQELTVTSVETADGRVLSFTMTDNLGNVPRTVAGRVADGKAELQTTAAGRAVASTLPWPDETVGFAGDEQSLAGRPMQPGERRTLQTLVPLVNQVATAELTAGEYERTSVQGAALELLRIEAALVLPDGQRLPAVMWTDRTGEVLKTASEAMQQETYRTTEEIALGRIDPVSFDLGLATLVPLDETLPDAHGSKSVRYRVRLKGGDPAAAFPAGLSQQVRRIDEHTAEITVTAVRPGQPAGEPDPGDLPKEADLASNASLQSDDAAVVAMAAEVAGGETDPWRVAQAIERYVHEAITEKNFGTAFATAADVARTREGDCTEHAVLLAALARAKGIPARVAVGLVYVPGANAFGYHMWDEVHVGGRWIALDGTLGRGGIGGGHLKLAHSNFQGTGAFSAFLPVAQVIGRLKIEVVDQR
jgi:hypothetical protein